MDGVDEIPQAYLFCESSRLQKDVVNTNHARQPLIGNGRISIRAWMRFGWTRDESVVEGYPLLRPRTLEFVTKREGGKITGRS